MTRFRTLYRSEIVSLVEWRCAGEDGSGRTPPDRNGLAFVRGGAFCRVGAGGEVLAQPGAVLFFRASSEYETRHPTACGDHGTVLGICDEVLEEAAWWQGVRGDSGAALERAYGSLPLSWALELKAMSTAARADGPPRLEVDETVLALAGAALAALASSGEDGPRRSDTRAANRAAVERVKRIVGDRFREPLPLSEIAREAAYSPYHLCRMFKRLEGVSIHRYLTRLRLMAALEELTAGVSLTRLAFRLGFCSHAHFTRTFHREFGVPPSAAARRLVGDAPRSPRRRRA